jgi:integration host factor subunit beta
MTKSELINRLAERYSQLVAKDAEYAVKTILDAMTNALATGQRIEIRGFGSFALNSRPPRIGRNPKSGDKVMVPEKRVPHFKPGKQLRERVDATGEADPVSQDLLIAVTGDLEKQHWMFQAENG